MYNLCKLVMNEQNSSILGHPLNVVFRSDNLEKISSQIKKRILDGCPARSLIVFEDVVFETECKIRYADKEESDEP